MSTPSPEVLQDINKLISVTTGFKPYQENFAACKKYCLSHFMHHSYSSVNKTTILEDLKEYERRFYIKARFELSQALNEQVHHFLSNEETFKNNPECEIEWNLLSLVLSLSSNLSTVFDVPKLLPLKDEEEPSIEIDWATYLKEGLPVYNYDSGSDTFSSLSSIESDLSPVSKSTDNFISALETISIAPEKQCSVSDIHVQRCDYLEKLKKRENEFDANIDIAKKGFLASRWKNITESSQNETCPLFIISEKEAIEKIIFCLVTGDNFSGIKNSTVSFISRGSFIGLLKILDPYVQAMNAFRTFIKNVESDDKYNSVVVRTYASCLKHYLMQYELKMLEISNEELSLIQLLQPIQPCLPYILGLYSAHNSCVSTWRHEPVCVTSFKIVSTFFNNMIESHRQDLRSTFLGIFLSCLSVFGDIINELFSSRNTVDDFQEFFIERRVSETKLECDYLVRSECKSLLNDFKLADAISNKVRDSSLSLSLIYVMNQHQYRNDAQDNTSINEYLCKALKSTYDPKATEIEEVPHSLMKAMSQLSVKEEDTLDFLQLPKWVEKSKCHTPVYKIISNALINAIDKKLDYIQNHAIDILVIEMGVEKHLNMLRRVLLFNDASILLPFLTVYFNEDSCWGNTDYLTFLLRECLINDFPDLAENISVVATPGSAVEYQNIIEAIDCINIEYEVPYPVSLVISAEIMKKYNAIFRVLLKVKWSHTLVNLPFPDKKIEFSPAAKYVLHRLQILRFSCLADLNLIQNYFMAQVAANLPCCSDYKDIQTLINDHDALISRIYARCMLSEGDQYYNLIFDSVMPLCFNLRRSWYLQNIQIVATLKHMESVFRTSHAKLQRIMVSLEKETYEPLLIKVKESITYVTHPTLQI